MGMLCLRIHAPDFPFEQKKIMAAELTDAVASSLGLPPEARQHLAIEFIPYRLENMAVGGRLLSETEEPSYQLEFQGFPLTPRQQEALSEQLMPLLLELLHLPPSERERIAFLFQEQARGSVALGG
jgi:hypothetical protein